MSVREQVESHCCRAQATGGSTQVTQHANADEGKVPRNKQQTDR